MTAFARLAQFEARTAHDHFAPVDEEVFEELLQVQDARLAVHQRHHVHAEAVLQLRQLVQVVEDDLRDFAALQLDHDAHAGLVRLVAQVGNAFEPFFADEFADPDEQIRLVHLVGNFVDDDGLAAALVDVLDVRARANHDATAAGAIAFAHAFQAVDDSGRREIGRRNDLHQFVDGDFGIAEQCEAARDGFHQVVRRDVGGHAHRDAGGPVDEQIGKSRRQYGRLELLAVVIRDEIDRFLVNIGKKFGSDLLQTTFGVAIGRGGIAVHGTEIALAVDQRIAQREFLHHPNQRFVGRAVAMRVIFAEHVADDARALHIGAVPDDVGLVHRKQHATMHRFQAVADIRKGTPHDHAHRVIEVGMPHFGFQADGKGFFGELLHGLGASFRRKAGLESGRIGKSAAETGFSGRKRPRQHRFAAHTRAGTVPEALESTQFYHGVVLPRQLLRPRGPGVPFLCGAKTRCAIFPEETKHLSRQAFSVMRKIASSYKTCSKPKPKG